MHSSKETTTWFYGQHTHQAVMTVMPFQKVERRYRMSCSRRGRYVLGNINATAGDFLGFDFTSDKFDAFDELVVPPVRYDIETGLAQYGGKTYGDVSVRRWIVNDPVLICGIREYTGREPQKAIHWPSSLRAGKLIVKQFDFTYDNEVLIILNTQTNRPIWNIDAAALEQCLSVTRTVAEELESQHIPRGFITNAPIAGRHFDSQFLASGTGAGHLARLLEMLGRVSGPANNSGFEKLFRNLTNERTYQSYIFITPELPSEVVPYINNLHRRCPHIVVISLATDNLDILNDEVPTFVLRKALA